MNSAREPAVPPIIAVTSTSNATKVSEGTKLNTGTVSSLPSSFCFPTSSTIAVSAPVPALESSVNGPTTQLNTMSLGPVFSVNPSQLMQSIPLSLAQQQTFTVALNQAQQFSTPTSIAMGPQTINVISQPVSQLGSTSLAGQSLGFVSPTLLTMPATPGQGQFLTSPFTQFPIMLGNHQNIITSINAAQSISAQTVDSTLSTEVAQGNGTLLGAVVPNNQQNSLANNGSVSQANQSVPVTKSISPSGITTIAANSPNNQEASVSSTRPTAAVNVANVAAIKTRQSSPDTTSQIQNSEASSSIDAAVKTMFERETEIKPQVTRVIGFSRMKYTPVDGVLPKASSPFFGRNDGDGLINKISSTLPEEQTKQQFHLEDNAAADSLTETKNSESLPLLSSSTAECPQSDQRGTSSDSVDKADDPQGDFADVEDLEDSEFVWEDYLKETGATSVPPTAFKHVEMSLQSGFSKGMKLEAPNKNNPNTCWVATIVMTCGPLLRLRYEGYDDNSSADFWSDPMTSDIHPLGWSDENGKSLQPPEVIQEKYPDWKTFLTKRLENPLKAPPYLLDKSTGATPVDQIQEGMWLEVQDVLKRNQVWLARIVENVGGRLNLRYKGIDTPAHDFCLFYLHERLHPIGWTEHRGYSYYPPQVVLSSLKTSEEESVKSLLSIVKELDGPKLSPNVFQDQSKVQPHDFQAGMKFEAVNPRDCHSLGPATVVEVTDKFYFIAEMDSVQKPASSSGDGDKNETESLRFACHKNTPTIFPVGWAASKGIKLKPPEGWDKTTFTWSEYLKSCDSPAAQEELFDLEVPEHEFECGMKLEAVNPLQPGQIGAATITQLVAHLVWVHLDGSPHLLDSHVASVLSLDLFPIGWCVSNGYQLQPPVPLRSKPLPSSFTTQKEPKKRVVAIVQPEMSENLKSGSYSQMNNNRDLFGGPQIYINHRCFSGPYLSKGRIAELPRSVGPGPLTLVMKEVLSMLINTAYKSSRVLRELQLEGKPNPDMVQQTLKAKYKGKSYRAVVEICRFTNQLEEFCRDVCVKLQCCPNLIGPHYIADECPEHCDQLTKTKYTYYYGKRKRKIGRPPGGHSNLEEGQQKPGGKRRKRKRIGMMAKRVSRPAGEDQEDNAEDDKESVGSDTRTVDSTSTNGSKEHTEKKVSVKPFAEKRGKLARERLALKRRYTHHIPPPSEIRTRGAKLPKYSFEKRTHKKIMIVEGSQQLTKPKKELMKMMQGLPKRKSLKDDDGKSHSKFMPSSLSGLPSSSVGQGSFEQSGAGNSSSGGSNIKPEPRLVLDSNPLEWTVAQVAEFLGSSECGDGDLVTRLKTEEIDGQALLLLTLPNIQEYLGIKLGPAIKLCHLIERVKVAFFQQYAH